VITAVRDVAKSPDIFIVTQNLLGVDSRYTEYLRLLYGNRMWVPSEKDVQQAFQRETGDAKTLSGIMAVIDKLTKMIFENNKTQHEFYVEESYVIPWMYPYLGPHGLIMKLNKEPLAQLDAAVVAQDRQFWDSLTKQLLADPRFLDNEWARKTFAKLRTSIGGVYAYRHMTNETEAVFKQALALGPTSPEAVFRLAEFQTEAGHFDDALAVLEWYHDRLRTSDPFRRAAEQDITQIREMKRKAE
jgi:hypothetical protein